jgi:hypothetical protein
MGVARVLANACPFASGSRAAGYDKAAILRDHCPLSEELQI